MAADTLITTATATSARDPVRLTRYSHGAGCGCKLSPQVLEVILAGSSGAHGLFPGLWVGNASRDDAAVQALDDERAVVSTTDFFMPIVDDPYDFGRIAATNAISDIYAMGADPLMAIAILGWPVNRLPAQGGRLRGGGDCPGRRPFHRRAGAVLWPGRDGSRRKTPPQTQRHGHGRLPFVPDQAARDRHPDHGRETIPVAPTGRRPGTRPDVHTEPTGQPLWQTGRRAGHDRCHGLRSARPPARNGRRQWPDRRARRRRRAPPGGDRALPGPGLRARRNAAQLRQLWRQGQPPERGTKAFAVRPPDQRWPAGCRGP